MTFEEIIYAVNSGEIVSNDKYFYVKPNPESPTYWKYRGEDTWTTGEVNFEDNVNYFEKEELWSIVRLVD